MRYSPSEPQRLARSHLLRHPDTFLLMGMGLGKTATIIDHLDTLLLTGEARAMLVIAPLAVCNLTWPNEVAKFEQFRQLRIADLRTEEGQKQFTKGTAHIYTVNWESLPTVAVLLAKQKSLAVPYDMVVFDECFAAGTLVDTPQGVKDIAALRIGDTVFNANGTGTITDTHINQVREVAVVRVAGQNIMCSSTHKFFTDSGWVEAKHLKAHKIFPTVSVMRMVREGFYNKVPWRALLRQILLCEMEDKKPSIGVVRKPEGRHIQTNKNMAGIGKPNCSKTIEKDFRTASYEEPGFSDAFTSNTETHRTQAPHDWRQWQRPIKNAGSSLGKVVRWARDMAHGICSRAWHWWGEQTEFCQMLQTGCGLPINESRHRSGWFFTPSQTSSRSGQEEDGIFPFAQVECVEIYKSSDKRLDNIRSSDGHIRFYDLSVSGHPSYSVNGLLVHNCTKAKSPQSKRAAIYREYCPRVARQIAMTGTPAPNSEADLWGQMMMVDGGKRLGPSFSNFQKTYFKPTDFRKYKWVLKDGAGERIYKRISDVTLTLRTSDWLDLPDTVVNDVEVDLGSALMSQYRQFEDDLVTQIRDKVITAPNAAALITKLMQFTSGATYDEEKLVHEIHDKKVRALVETVRKIDGPTLIGYAYQHEVDRLRKALPKAEFFSDYKNKAAQVQMLARWNAGRIPQLVAHPASMAHGLNMQDGGCNLVWYSQTYSREKSEQMLGRLFRRGQRNEVNLWRLMCPGTVDYAVALALENKAASENTLLTALQSLEAFRRGGGVVEIGDDSDLMEDDEY